MSFNMDGSPRRVRCILRRAVETAKAAAPEIDLVELKNVILRALMPFREAHMAVADALRARWPEQLRC